MVNPNNETSTKEDSFKERKQYDAPDFQTASKKSSQQSIRQHEELVYGTREYDSAYKGGKAQKPKEMQLLVGGSPMLERWQRETARDGPFNNIDAVVVKRRDASSTEQVRQRKE